MLRKLTSIPKSLFQILRQRAKYRCEYCHYPEILSSAPLSVDHLQPQSLGGSDNLDNLALACRCCNEIRYNFTMGIDPETQTEIPLFNPRRQEWSDHFIIKIVIIFKKLIMSQQLEAIFDGTSFQLKEALNLREQERLAQQQRVESLLIEGLDSGKSVEATDDWWSSKRAALDALHRS